MSPSLPNVIVLDDPIHGFNYSHRKQWRGFLKVILASHAWQVAIIGLVILDACFVIVDIILAQVYCSDAHPPHAVEQSEEVLRIASITILSFFILEWILEAWVQGIRRWSRHWLHLLDLSIIVTSWTLEVVAVATSSAAVELGGLLVVGRLWRMVRVVHAVGDVGHHVAHDRISELEQRNNRLRSLIDAHHIVIAELHKEYAQRMHEHLSHLDLHPDQVGKPGVPTPDQVLDAVAAKYPTHGHVQQSVWLHRDSLLRATPDMDAYKDTTGSTDGNSGDF